MAVALTGRERRRYFGVVTVVPLLGAPLAVNGGPVFQILAIENLGLNAEQVGLAVGLGAISIPFQMMAARIPLRAAHRNLRLFICLMSAMCLIMAWLIPGPISTSLVIAAVIAIAVLAELAVSVLFATSFQPLLSTTVDSGFRQRLNAQGRAVGGVAAILLVGLVSVASTTGRVAILIALALLGLLLAYSVSSLRRADPGSERDPEPQAEAVLAASAEADGDASEIDFDSDGTLTWVYVAIGISLIPAWPFAVTYASAAFWPSANLGAIGVALVLGPLAAAAAWRPTTGRLGARARLGGIATLLCALALVPLNPANSGWTHGAIFLVIITVSTGAAAVVRMALLELAHRRSNSATSVGVLTRFDVIASTSMQLGFLASGYLIDLSVDSSWPVDPFQLSLIVAGAMLVVALGALPKQWQ